MGGCKSKEESLVDVEDDNFFIQVVISETTACVAAHTHAPVHRAMSHGF